MRRDKVFDATNIAYVFLDRDGVLNRNPPNGGYVSCWEEFELLAGVEQAIAELNRSGRRVILVTNQRGIALGLYTRQDLCDIHSRLEEHLAGCGSRLDAIYVCPHDDGECDCRKPLTGLFQQAFRDFPEADPQNSVMVGDSLRDIEAGIRVGMRTVFVKGGRNASSSDAERAESLASLTVSSLPDLVSRYLCPRTRV